MPFVIFALTLFNVVMVEGTNTETDAERLAEMFSPILILTEETGGKWGDIIVTKPEPVGIMGATSADNIQFDIYTHSRTGQLAKVDSALLGDETWFNPKDVQSNEKTWDPGKERIKLLENKFAYFNGLRDLPFTATAGSQNMTQGKSYTLKDAYFDFSGVNPTEWNNTYKNIGENHPNTSYVHIYKRVIDQYKATYDSVTVIQYHYFYPYNHWWNKHEGDWPRIDVVVSSSDPATAIILGVEYRFHGAWLNYYKDWGNKPGLTSNFVFNPKKEVKLSPGPKRSGIVQYTHPIVYVGAGSHGGYPIGGEIQVYDNLTGPSEDEARATVFGDFEHMTHTGLVLSTQASASGSSLWERYRLQLLPEPDLADTNNMGLADTLSWLGARIRWGTPKAAVGGVGEKESPKGPYNSNSERWGSSKGWGELKFFKIGKTGRIKKYEMHHKNLPYKNYHHWAVIGQDTIGQDTLSTVSLKGDVVVFPGATLTVKAGTAVTFPSNKDRHQFKQGDNSLSEILVYGTLKAEGTASDSIFFKKSGTSGGNVADLPGQPQLPPGQSRQHWGGILKMPGGTVDLHHTAIRHTLPGQPTQLTATRGDSQVVLTWTPSNHVGNTGWKYLSGTLSGTDTTWGAWQVMAHSGASTTSDTVTGLTNGSSYTFKVRAVNANGEGPSSAASAAVIPAGPPLPPLVSAVAADQRVQLTWTAGKANGSPITGYQYRQSADGGTTWDPGWTGRASPITRFPLVNDTEYTFQVRAGNAVGYGTAAQVKATPWHPIEGRTAISYAEDRVDTVASYRRRLSELSSVQGPFTWSLEGTDASAFRIAKSGRLSFGSAPDFEEPTDTDSNNVYTLQVRVTPTSKIPVGQALPPPRLAKTVTVTVTNVDEPGTVSLSSSQPRVDTRLTATLTDPDSSVSGTSWQWQRLTSRSSAGTPIASATSAKYTPQAADVGRWLVARASYTDGHGAGKSAADTTAVAVVDAPSAPTLTAAAGDRRVALRWTAADSNGAWVTGYSLRDSSAGGSWSDWTAVPGGGAARDSTLKGLTNGREYTFEVRAKNTVGDGDSSRVSATPQARTLAGPDSISYAENGTDTVAVYRVTPAGGSWTWSRAGTDSSAFSGGDTLRFAQVPNYEKPVDADSNNVYTLQVRATPAAPGLSPLSKAVVVTVTNVNEPGAISFSPSRPKVNQPITATLSDADTVASVRHWRWLPYIEGGIGIGGEEAEETAAAAATICPGMVSCTYTPGLFFRYLPLEVTVFYADHLASGQQVQVVTAAVGGPNRGPTLSGVSDTTFVENDTAAVALYTAADADGDALRWSLTGADSSAFRWQGSGLTRALRFGAAPDYEAKSTYRVTAGVSDGAVAATQAVTVRVTNVDEAPVLSGPADTTVVEHGSGAVALYRAVDPEGEAVTWSLSGADRDTLALSGGGQLSFKRAPDYERPADADSDNVYAVRVRAFDGPLGDSLAVTVRVSNVEEAGTVRLSSPAPQAGTALSATLSDPDSVWASTVGWQWQRLSSRSAAGTPIGSATSASYTPKAADVGRWLVARAAYRDGHGAGKSAADTTAAAVAGRPGAPKSLAASAGDKQVALRWTAADSNGAWVTGYSLRDSLAGGSWSSWTVVPGGGAARKDTVTGLTNDTLYTFEVRAKNKVGTGDSSRVSATPRATPPPSQTIPPPVLSATAGNRQVALSWIYTGKAPVSSWQSRRESALGDFSRQGQQTSTRIWGPWTNISGSNGSTRKDTVTGLTNGSEYGFEVRGVNGGVKGGASNKVTVTPKAPPPAATLSASAGNAQVALSWTYTSTVTVTKWQQRHKAGSKTWGSWTGVAGSSGSTRKDTVTGLTNDTLYTFEVRGLNGEVNGTASNQVTATPQAPPPPPKTIPPPVLSATAGNAQVALSWTYTSTVTVTGWQYRRESALGDFSAGQKTSTKIWGPWTPISGADTRSHTVTGLTNGSEYGFEVRGVNGSIKGTASNKVTATPQAPPPPAPPAPTLSASAGNGRVTLSWAYGSTVTVTGWQYRRESDFEDLSGGQKTTTRVWGPWKSISGAATRSHTVTQLTNGSEYGFEVRGVNGKTEGTASNKVTATPKAPATAPGAPGSLSASAGNKQVALSWSAAASNGSAIQRYEYRRGSGSWTTVSGGSGARSQTVTGLTNGTSYTFSVRAVNGVGAGTAASASATPAGRPGSPGGLSASAGNRQVTLSWSAAASNGSAIQRYEYRRGSGGWTTVSGGGSARSQTVTGLTNGTSYTFSVRAVNGVGAGTAASASATPAGRPGSPGSLSASAGNKQVTLSWSAAASNGSAIQRYEYRRGLLGSWTTVSGGGSARSQTVTGLTNGTTYLFYVRAVNGKGAGSAASASAKPAGLPGSPGSLSAAAGFGQVTLSWSAAASNGSAIQRYEYQHSGNSWATVSGGSGARSQTVTGLTGGVSYTFYVRAVNGVGAGTAASKSAVPIDDFALGANQPNPFNPETTLRYALPAAQPVRLTVYDMLGQQVRVLVDGEQPPGWHQVVWDGRDQVGRPVASGIYLYRLQTPQFSQTRKMILLR